MEFVSILRILSEKTTATIFRADNQDATHVMRTTHLRWLKGHRHHRSDDYFSSLQLEGGVQSGRQKQLVVDENITQDGDDLVVLDDL